MATAERQIPEMTEDEERKAFLHEITEEVDLPFEGSQAEADTYLDHLLEKLSEREAEIERTNDIATRRMAMIQSWQRQQIERAERESRWLRLQIEVAADGYDFGKKRSRSLPNGSFGFRKTQDRVEITDMDKAVAFAEANGLEVKKSVGKTPLKTHFKATGEVPDGAEFVPGDDVFFVKSGG